MYATADDRNPVRWFFIAPLALPGTDLLNKELSMALGDLAEGDGDSDDFALHQAHSARSRDRARDPSPAGASAKPTPATMAVPPGVAVGSPDPQSTKTIAKLEQTIARMEGELRSAMVAKEQIEVSRLSRAWP